MTNNHVAMASPHTAFVLGNGPSLRGIDLKNLSGFQTVGLNAAYRYWQTIDWRPTYYACLDEVVGLSHKEAIAELILEGRIESFLLRGNLIAELGQIAKTHKVLNFDSLRSRQSLLTPPTITTGSHAALWMATMGFEQIVLLGIDGQYKEFVDGAERRDGIELEIVETKAANPNYFFDNYQQAGDRYNIPNPRPGLHVEAWHAAAQQLQSVDVTIFNANDRSEVSIFPYVQIDDFLGTGSQIAPARQKIPITEQPSIGLSAKGPKSGTKAKLGRFIKSQGRGLTFAAGVIGAGSILAGHLSTWQPIPLLLTMITSGFLFSLCALLLYTRFGVTEHLARLQTMQDSLTQRLADIDRLGHPNR
ncbi:MAG: hypothetical protein ABJG15_19165 [Hyphomonadaceae bacterium]